MDSKNFITDFGLFSTIVVAIVGVGIFSYPQEIETIVGTDSWMVTIFAGIVIYFLLYAAYYAIKINGFERLYIILKNNFGWIFGTVFAFAFIAYNIVSISSSIRIFAEVVKMYLLEKTPTEFIFIIIILTGIYLITGGLENVVKFNQTAFWLMFVPVGVILVLTLGKADFSNMLPVFTSKPYEYLKALKTSVYSFSGIEIVYIIMPYLKNRKSAARISFKSILFVTLFYTAVVAVALSIFSKNETGQLLWPAITMTKSISASSIFIQRWEGLVMAMWILFCFTNFANIYYFSSDLLKDIFKFKTLKLPSVIMGILIYVTALYPKNIAALYDMTRKYISIFFLITIILVPFLIIFFSVCKNRKGLKKILPLFLICVLFTGCWDKTEIENKQLISVIGIDAGEDAVKDSKGFNGAKQSLKNIHLTFGMPDLSQVGPDKGAQASDKYIEADGFSFQDAVSNARLKSSRSIKFSHTDLLVLSEKLVKYPDLFKETLDYLHREPSLNRNMYVVLSKGDTSKYIKLKTDIEKNMETYVIGLIQNDYRNSRVIPVTLNDFMVEMSENGNSLLPVIDTNKDTKDIEVQGSAVIKNFILTGELNPTQTSDIELLKGKLKGSNKVIYVGGHPLDINIDDVSRKVKVHETGGKLKFDVKLKIESQIKDYYLGKKLFSVDELNYIQNVFNDSIKKDCYKTLYITQDKYKADLVGFREYVQKYHPVLWKKIKNNWDEKYKNAVIDLNIDTQIRRIGVSK